jgi:hypothetical protein
VTPTVTLELRNGAEGWTWSVLRGEERLGEGVAIDGDAALAVARATLDSCLSGGLEAEICGVHWRKSVIRPRP